MQVFFADKAKGVVRMWIYTPYITTKSGKRIYAYQYGKRAFRFWSDKGHK